MIIFKEGKTNWKHILIVAIFAAIVSGVVLGYQYWWLPKSEVKIPEVKVPEEATQPESEAVKLSGKILIYTGHAKELKGFIYRVPIFAYSIDTREKRKLFNIDIGNSVSWGGSSISLSSDKAVVYQNNLVILDSETTLTLYDLLSGEKSTLFTAKRMIEGPLTLDRKNGIVVFFADDAIYTINLKNKQVTLLIEKAKEIGKSAWTFTEISYWSTAPLFFSEDGNFLYLYSYSINHDISGDVYRYNMRTGNIQQMPGYPRNEKERDFYILTETGRPPCELGPPPYTLTLYDIKSGGAAEIMREENRFPDFVHWTPNDRGFVYEVWTAKGTTGVCRRIGEFLYYRYYNIDSRENKIVTLSEIKKLFRDQGGIFYDDGREGRWNLLIEDELISDGLRALGITNIP